MMSENNFKIYLKKYLLVCTLRIVFQSNTQFSSLFKIKSDIPLTHAFLSSLSSLSSFKHLGLVIKVGNMINGHILPKDHDEL